MSSPRVLLMRLSERTSAKGNTYLSGWLGKACLIGFKAKEPDQYGNEVWEIYVQEPEDRDQAQQQTSPARNAERGQSRWDRSRNAAQRLQEPPQGWLDDSEAAIRDLEGRGR